MHERLAIAVLLVLLAFEGVPQSIEVVVQKGHSGDINRIVFNADGHLLASAGSDNLIKLWHVPTGKEMASFISGSSSPVDGLMFSDNDDFLYVHYTDGLVHTWDITQSTLHSTTIRPSAQFSSGKIFRLKDNRYEVSIDRFYLRKRSIQNNKTVFSKVPVDISKNFTAVSVSEENNLIAASNEDGKVYVFTLSTGKSLGILEGHYSSVNDICFSPDGKLFATASSDRSIILWDSENRVPVRRLFGRSFRFEAVTFNHSGTQLAVGDELGNGRIIDLLSGRVRVSVSSWHTQKVSAVAFSPDDSLVYSAGYDNRMIRYSVPASVVRNTWKYKKYFSAGDFLLKKLKAYREPYAWVQTLAVSPSGNSVALGGSWRESVPREQAEPILIHSLIENKSDKLLSHQGGVNDLCFIDDQNFVSIGGNVLLNWVNNPTDGKYYFRRIEIPYVKNLRQVILAPGNTLLLRGDSIILHYDIQREMMLDSLHTPGEITSLACHKENGNIAYSLFNELVFTSLDRWHTERNVVQRAHTDRITGIDYSPSPNLLATVSWDATIKLWEPETGTLKATIISVGRDDHLIITPDNYYYGTRNSIRGIGFKYGKQFISPEQFDLLFNRPDIVLQRLGFVPETIVRSFNRAYKKRLQKMKFTEDMLGEDIHLPEVKIISKRSATVTEPQFALTINATDSKYLLDRLNIYINHVPVYGMQGIDLRSRGTGITEEQVSLMLSPGRNKIQVSCLNEKGVESLLQTFEVDYQAARIPRPTLYLAVLSVSDYKDKAMSLKYAAKDGRDIVTQFSRTGFFEKIVVDTLFDRLATLDNISNLRERFMKSSVNDHVILYISGHGMLDENLDFYFATYDVDFKNPSGRGVRYDDLENLLDGIPARNKLLLMDACHSGEVDKSSILVSEQPVTDKNVKGNIKTYTYPVDVAAEHHQISTTTSFELMQELFANLSKGSGAVVISAAAGNSYALESDEWQNGVFTFSILNGLKSKIADSNRNGHVTVTELKDFVSREVERLTRGAQKPTSRRENLEFDFRVY